MTIHPLPNDDESDVKFNNLPSPSNDIPILIVINQLVLLSQTSTLTITDLPSPNDQTYVLMKNDPFTLLLLTSALDLATEHEAVLLNKVLPLLCSSYFPLTLTNVFLKPEANLNAIPHEKRMKSSPNHPMSNHRTINHRRRRQVQN